MLWYGLVFGGKPPNPLNLRFNKLLVVISATLFNAILHVDEMATSEQVIWSVTCPVVAFVADAEVGGNWPISEKKRLPMGGPGANVWNVQDSIAATDAEWPFQTFIPGGECLQGIQKI